MAEHSQFQLLRERRFAPFFWTQFLGAGNDNIYKNALVIFVAFQAATLTALSANDLVNIAAAVFIAPFVLFSATSGQLADKFEKSQLIRLIKLFEIAIMVLGAIGFYGATYLTQFATFTKDVLGGDEHVATLLLAIFSVGIGVGSLLCERLSRHKVEIGLVPFGSIGLSVFAVDLYFASRGLQPGGLAGVEHFVSVRAHWRIVADLVLLGMFGGFYIVPLYALIQERSDPAYRSRIIAANNILNALFMVASAGIALGLLKAGLSIPALFLATGLMNAVVALYIYLLVPEFLMRFLAWLLIHSVYRVDKQGLEQVPA